MVRACVSVQISKTARTADHVAGRDSRLEELVGPLEICPDAIALCIELGEHSQGSNVAGLRRLIEQRRRPCRIALRAGREQPLRPCDQFVEIGRRLRDHDRALGLGRGACRRCGKQGGKDRRSDAKPAARRHWLRGMLSQPKTLSPTSPWAEHTTINWLALTAHAGCSPVRLAVKNLALGKSWARLTA